MNQGKLEVVTQETVKVKVDILSIWQLKWTGKGEFNSDDYYIYYCGKETLRRIGVAIMVITWMQSQNERMISVHFQGKLFSIMVIQVFSPTRNAEEAEEAETDGFMKTCTTS